MSVGEPDLVGDTAKDGGHQLVLLEELDDRGRGDVVRALVAKTGAVEGEGHEGAPAGTGIEGEMVGELGHEREPQTPVRALRGSDGGDLELPRSVYLYLQPVLVGEDLEHHFGTGRRVLDGIGAGLGAGHLDVEAPLFGKTGLGGKLRDEVAGPADLG